MAYTKILREIGDAQLLYYFCGVLDPGGQLLNSGRDDNALGAGESWRSNGGQEGGDGSKLELHCSMKFR